MLSCGSSLRATPSTTTIVFCSITSSTRVDMSNSAVTSNSSVSSFAIEIWSAVREWIGSPIARIAWAKSSTRWTCGHVARLEMDFRDPPIVAPDEAEQDLGEEAALLPAEAAHDAEIDRDDAARRRRRRSFPDACRRGRSRRAAHGGGRSG